MRIIVAAAFRPEWEPASTDLGPALEQALEREGHAVEAIRIPFEPSPDSVAPQLLALRLTDVGNVGDLLIATAAPFHLLRHRRKVLWLSEHYPWLEDVSEPPDWLRLADQLAIDEAHTAYAVSSDLCARIARVSDRVVVPLPPPAAEEQGWSSVVSVLTGT